MKNTEIGSSRSMKIASVFFSVGMLLIATLVNLFNMGWFRVILAWTLAPVWHAAMLVTLNLFAVKYFRISRKILFLNVIYNTTYLLTYLCLPDFGDTEPISYVFFGLIQGDVAAAWFPVSGLFATLNIVLFIWQIVWMCKEQKNIKKSWQTK